MTWGAAVAWGSSPRGRGKPGRRLCRVCLSRLIPAWAGKTWAGSATCSRTPAHPRVGGENPPSCGCAGEVAGSSPRGRGKLASRTVTAPCAGLIPAWAGKTRVTWGRCPRSAAHPRVGGENFLGAPGAPAAGGSSPRGRGKRVGCVGELSADRLIPAWAGKTRWTAWSRG